MLAQLQQINQTLETSLPCYKALNSYAVNLYSNYWSQAQGAIIFITQTTSTTKQQVLKNTKQITDGVEKFALEKTDKLLTKFEQLIDVTKQETSSTLEIKSPKKRLYAIVVRLNELFILNGDQVRKYSMDLVQKGRNYMVTICFPLYVSLKATVLVTKQMVLELLESRINRMKVSYQASKDTVTMMISGKFEQEHIRGKITQGLKNFKRFTVNVVQKGLEIKVDRESLLENYDTFSLKFLEAIRSMREIGTENIQSIRQRSVGLYNNVINRIKQKQIEIRTKYYQETQSQQ